MIEILIIIALILLNGFLSMAEMAVSSVRKAKLTAEAKAGNNSARTALFISEKPERFFSTVQIGITLIGILTGIYSGATVATDFGNLLLSLGVSAQYAHPLAQLIIVVLVTYFTIVFGELLPKLLGKSHALSVAKSVAHPMLFLTKLMLPFVWFLEISSKVFAHLFGLRIDEEEVVTEDEIISMVQESLEDGEVQEVEQDIVERVFMMGDLNINSIMTQRSDIVWIDCRATIEEIRRTLHDELHELYPVADGGLDNIKGIITLKQLVMHLNDTDFSLEKVIQEPHYYYENMKVYNVLETMKSTHESRGIVVDESGTCIGIITLRDIIEGLFGTIPGQQEEAQIVARENNEGWLIDGSCTMLDFLSYFDREEFLPDEDFNTVAGLCYHQLNNVPTAGERFEWLGFSFEIVDMDHAKIDKILVKHLHENEETQSGKAE